MPTLADEVVAVLRTHGVQRIFGIPGGGSSLDLIDAAARVGIPFVLTRTEAAATLMAAVTGELTGAPGVALVGVGPGASSAVNGVAYASLERSPMALFIDGPAASPHQHFDQPAVFAPLTRGAARLNPSDGAASLDALLSRSITAPEGPVVVEMTARDADTEATGFVSGSRPLPGLAPQSNLTAAQDLLVASRRPLVIVGLEARQHSKAVRGLINALGAAVMTTYKAAGVFSAEAPEFIGTITGAVSEIPLIMTADLIVGVGFDPIELIPGTWPDNAAPVIMLSESAPANPRVPVSLQVRGSLASTLDGLTASLDGLQSMDTPKYSDTRPSVNSWGDNGIEAMHARMKGIYVETGEAFSCARAVMTMIECLDHHTRLTVDAGAQ